MHLIDLGRILDELPKFKDMTTACLTHVLDTCQEQQPWGFAYLFKLGIVLEQVCISKHD